MFYVAIANDCHDVIVVEVQAPSAGHAQEAVYDAYGGWLDSAVFKQPPIDADFMTLEEFEAFYTVDGETK